jgi:signal transduction histidine kinase
MSKPVPWLLVAFITPLVLLIAIGVFSYYSNTRLNKALDQSDHTREVILQAEKIISTLKDIESGVRGYIYIKDSTFLEPYISGRKEIIEHLRILDSLVTPTAPQQAGIVKLNHLAFRKINTLDSILQIVKIKDDSDSLKLIELMRNGKLIMDEARILITALIIEEQNLQTDLNETKIHYSSRVRIAQWVLIFFGIVFFAITYWRMIVEWQRRIKYQFKLEQKVQELETQNKELEDFSFVLSHQLQEPLRKLGTFTDKLQLKHSDELNEETSYMLKRIGKFSTQISKLVGGIHSIANLKKQNRDQWGHFSLESVLEEVIKAYDEKIKSKSAVIDIDSNLPMLKGNFLQLVLLFKQLLDNSLTFVKQDQRPYIKVSVTEVKGNEIEGLAEIKQQAQYLNISFADNGIGFSSDFTDKVFEIFQKLEQNENDEGLGLGLAICKKIVLNHDGEIVAESQTGEGTIIKIYLPIL